MTPDLLILCATLAEMSYFLSAHPPKAERVTRTGPRIFSGRLNDKAYDLMITGPGVFNAAHALTVYLEQASPALVLQTGIAGVFRETGLDIGDVAVASSEHYIHTGIATDALSLNRCPLTSSMASPQAGRGATTLIRPGWTPAVNAYPGGLNIKASGWPGGLS
nr:hypothetical protein [Desulfobacula sp.]